MHSQPTQSAWESLTRCAETCGHGCEVYDSQELP